MEKQPLYTVDWEHPSGFVELDVYKIPLPAMPPLETMENYGLPIEDQKFKRTIIPNSLLKRKAVNEEEEAFIRGEYHKIHNGVWVIIKDTPVYITGAYYFFLNYWTTNQGKKPDFKKIQCDLFLMWEMVINDPNSYGLFLVKPRRIGGTEITIEWLYVDVLRYRNMVCGMQSKNEDSVFKNYRRILNAHKNMIWFMKPINQGSTGNKEGLFLRYPEQQQTHKKLKEQSESGDAEDGFTEPEINSDLTYQPSVATAYDGERLDRYILNEFGKCFGRGTLIMLYSGKVKRVEDIEIGDLIMGADGNDKAVLSLSTGEDIIHRILPDNPKFNSWTCTADHILSLKWTGKNLKGSWKYGDVVNVSLRDFNSLGTNVKNCFRLYSKNPFTGEQRTSSFKTKEIGETDYFGFGLDGDHLFLLGDYQVTHNCEKMSVVDCWDKVKPCLHLDNGLIITGKAVCESTIEEINDDQIQELVEMWNDSNCAKRDENGRTMSGLYSLFISAIDAAKEDEWGFPKKQETLDFLNRQFEALKKAGKSKDLAKLKRKTPLVIEDALTPSGDQCAFNKDNLIDALSELDFPDKDAPPPGVRGNLMWENGVFDSRVIFEANPEGRWYFTMLGGENRYKDNAVDWYNNFRIPGNPNKIRIGVDPYDHKETVDSRKSKGGAVGGIMYDEMKDGAKVYLDSTTGTPRPIDLGKEWESYQPIFTYYFRQPDPSDFFEDMLMSAVYCGAPVLFESNKQSIRKHFEDRGYAKFLMPRPEVTLSEAQRKSQAQFGDGAPASENTIATYYNLLDTYISRNAKSIKTRDLLVDLLAMNRQNHGKHDLGVAFGWLLVALNDKIYKEAPKEEEEPEPWFDVYEI